MKVMRENLGLAVLALIVAVLVKSYVSFIDPMIQIELTVPVQPRSLSQGLSLSSINPSRVDMEISGAKSKVEKYSERNFTAIADCAHITAEGNYQVKVRLTQSRLKNMNVKFNLYPDTVYLVVGRSEKKFFSPETQKEGILASNKVISKIEGLSDTVQVSGSAKFLEQVEKVIYPLNLDEVNEGWTGEVTFVAIDKNGQPIDNLKIDPPNASITVYLRENKIKLMLPVILRTRGTPANSHAITSQTVDPQQVEVSGDPTTIASLTSIETETVSISQATSDITSDVNLVSPDPKILLKPSKVSVKITITQVLTKRDIEGIPIELKKQQPGFTYRVEPSKMNVRIQGPLEKLSALDITQIHPSIDVSVYDVGSYTVSLNQPELPSGVNLLNMMPTDVELVVDKTETDAEPRHSG